VPAEESPDDRHVFEQQARDALLGQTIESVAYWDIHNFSDEPRTWDYEDWHHAVMGLELTTSRGPVSIIWTSRFFPYGVEVFDSPISQHLLLGPEGPESWSASDHRLWEARRGQPVTEVSFFWEHIEVGPARTSDGEVVSEAADYDVPVALRLDFSTGPVWFVAGIPQYPDVEVVFVPGDEIIVVFSPERMRRIGFPDGAFLR
jgi:hypothetical protein